MKIIKFIKVNTIIVNIILVVYEIITAICAVTMYYTSDRQIALYAFGMSIIAILITNISAKHIIDIFKKVYENKK